MVDLPSVNEEFTADSGPYVRALLAMAEAADRATAAQDRLFASIEATQRLMDAQAATAAGTATAEERLAGADTSTAEAAAAAALAAGRAADEQRSQAEAAGTAAAAEDAAAEAAAKLSAANRDVASSAFDASGFERALNAVLRAEIASAGASATAARTLASAQEAVAAAAEVAAEGEAKLAEAEAAGSLAAFQDAQAAKVFAEADAVVAASAELVTEVIEKQSAIMTENAAALRLAALAGAASADSSAKAAAGAAAANRGFRLWGTGIRITGTALHWIVAGTFEFLAVAIPAMVALAAGMAVAAQGAQNVQQHFAALYTATEATANVFHQTVGTTLGLGDALQQAQNAANPGVYTILGSAVSDAKTGMSSLATVGLQVVHMLDEFSARITVDLQSGGAGQLQGLLSGMVTDLQEFGQILGNVGHAILNFASGMPGLARVLLAIADAASRLILAISEIPAPIITAFMALEEFYRWGGLALRMIISLAGAPAAMVAWYQGANFIRAFGTSLLQLGQWGGIAIQGIGRLVSSMSGFIPAAARAGQAIETFGADAALASATMDPMLAAGIAGGVAAIAGLIIVLGNVKDATDKWVASTDQAVQAASDLNVYSVASKTLAENQVKLAAASQQLNTQMDETSRPVGAVVSRFGAYSGAIQRTGQDVMDLEQQQQFLMSTTARVTDNAIALGQAYHVSGAEALFLANAAGVNLQSSMAKGSTAFNIALQQIRNYAAGIGAMNAPFGVLGADVEALGIQSQLASTKVQQLNSAWDAWIGTVTGGAAAMAQAETAISGMANATQASSALLSGTITSVTRATQQGSYTLRGFGQNAMQSWQQFTSAVQTGNTALDSLRTGMAEGVVSGSLFESTVKGLVGQMAPFTQGNRAAVTMLSQLAKEASGPTTTSLKTLEKWAGVTGNTARDQFARGMLTATTDMGNMAKVAQNLSAVVNSQLNAAMAAAIVKSSSLGAAVSKYAQDLGNTRTPASQLAADEHAIASAMERANSMTANAAKGLSDAATQADKASAAAQKASQNTGTLGTTSVSAADRISIMQRQADLAATSLGTRLAPAGRTATSDLAQGITSGSGQVIGAMNQTVQGVTQKANGMAGLLHVSGYNASLGAASGIYAGEGAVVAAATAVANAASAAFAAHLHVHSPSTLTHQYGEWFAQGLADGMLAKQAQVEAAARALAEAASRALGITSLTPVLAGVGAGGAGRGGYSPAPIVPAAAGMGGSVQVINVSVPVAGHVVTDMQLMDFIRDGVQQYIPRNADNGFMRRGRSS